MEKDKDVIGICYDSPTNNEDQSNMLYNDICTTANSDLIIMGDFNRSGINCMGDNKIRLERQKFI